MKRTWTGLLAAVLSVGCVTGLEDGSTDDHGMEITISGGDLRSTFALVDGYFESPVMAVPEGATRVAAMLTLTDVPLEMDGRPDRRACARRHQPASGSTRGRGLRGRADPETRH